MKILRIRLRKICIFLFWLVLWQLFALCVPNKLLFAGPLQTLRALAGLLHTSSFWAAAAFSFFRICAGFFLAFLTGLLTGSLSFAFPFLDSLLSPPIQLIKSVPVASFVILALLWIGSRNLSVCISFLIVYPAIHIHTLAGFKSVDPQLLETARVFAVPLPRKAFYLYRPFLYPHLRNACQTCVGMAFKSGVAAEVIGVPESSVGEGLYLSKIYLSPQNLFAWTFVVILMSFLFEKLFLALLQNLCGPKTPAVFKSECASPKAAGISSHKGVRRRI